MGGTPLLYQGQLPKSTWMGLFERRPVIAVTEWEFSAKIALAFTHNGPRLKIPPRPGPGSSGQPVSGSPSTPDSGGPPLSFWAFFESQGLHLSASSSIMKGHRQQFPGGTEPSRDSLTCSRTKKLAAGGLELDAASPLCPHRILVHCQQSQRTQPVLQQP